MDNLMHLESCSSTVIGNSLLVGFLFFFTICVQAQGLYMVYAYKLCTLCTEYTGINLCAYVHT